MEHEDINALLKEIQANQQSLHDDMVVAIDRLTKLEIAINELTQHSNEPSAIDEHQLYIAARALVVETEKASTSMLQRVLRIGYSRAASLIDTLEENNVIGPQDGSRPREVLIDRDELSNIEDEENDEESETDQFSDTDELYEDAKKAVIEAGKASTSYLQRKLRIGYTHASRLIDLLEERGVVGPANCSAPREILKN